MVCILGSLLLIGVGVVIGWNVQPPAWAIKLQAIVQTLVKLSKKV